MCGEPLTFSGYHCDRCRCFYQIVIIVIIACVASPFWGEKGGDGVGGGGVRKDELAAILYAQAKVNWERKK